jgi:hypothetical protein
LRSWVLSIPEGVALEVPELKVAAFIANPRSMYLWNKASRGPILHGLRCHFMISAVQMVSELVQAGLLERWNHEGPDLRHSHHLLPPPQPTARAWFRAGSIETVPPVPPFDSEVRSRPL